MAHFETRRWEADFTTPGGRQNRKSFTYQAFVPDALEGFDPSLPSTSISLVVEAEQAVQALNLRPPPLASLEVLARRLLRSEAVASSFIEGLKISQRRLARAEAGGAGSHPQTRFASFSTRSSSRSPMVRMRPEGMRATHFRAARELKAFGSSSSGRAANRRERVGDR